MSGETSPDIRRSSYLSSALVNYVIGTFLMEERKDEREKREHILVCFIVFLDKRIKRENKRKVLTVIPVCKGGEWHETVLPILSFPLIHDVIDVKFQKEALDNKIKRS